MWQRLMVQNRKRWNHYEVMEHDEMLIRGKYFVQVINAETRIMWWFDPRSVTSMTPYRCLEPRWSISDSYWISPHSAHVTRKGSHENDYFTWCWDYVSSVQLLRNVMNRQLKAVVLSIAEDSCMHDTYAPTMKLSNTYFIWRKSQTNQNLQILYLETTQQIRSANATNAMVSSMHAFDISLPCSWYHSRGVVPADGYVSSVM